MQFTSSRGGGYGRSANANRLLANGWSPSPVYLQREQSQPWQVSSTLPSLLPVSTLTECLHQQLHNSTVDETAEQEVSTAHTITRVSSTVSSKEPSTTGRALVAAGLSGKQTLEESYILQTHESRIYSAVIAEGRNELH